MKNNKEENLSHHRVIWNEGFREGRKQALEKELKFLEIILKQTDEVSINIQIILRQKMTQIKKEMKE